VEEIVTQRIWLITGASRGFGAEIAKAALAAGDKVVATARSADALDTLGDKDRVLGLGMDVTNEPHVTAAVDAAVHHFGRIDVLVNNAGFGLLGGVEEASADEVERIFRTNVFGLLNVTRAVLPTMRKQRSGHVINISSIGGFRSFPGWGIYSATKFAVEGISEALREEVAPLGIHVTVVEPGYFRTDFLDSRSLARTAHHIGDYDESVGKTREMAAERNHAQQGDPGRLGQALLRLVNAKEPPLRLPLGTDAVQGVEAKLKYIESELESWRAVSASTDFDQKTAAQA
jgi:NAD(P)-dependent dehydrogenase (short-subunit alcohol dehydrogenase family)